MKVGVKLPNSGPFAKPEHIRVIAMEVERLGFDSLWVHDHVTRSPSDAEHHFVFGAWEAWEQPIVPNVYESLSTLAYVGGMTTRVQLGTSCVVIPLRNPVWLAKMAATIDSLSGGRMVLGVGVGGSVYVDAELKAMGAPSLYKDRGKVVDEWIDIMRKVWAQPTVTYGGQFIRLEGAEVYPKPLHSNIPIWVAGASGRARRRVAERGDGWLPMFLRPGELRDGLDEIRTKANGMMRDGNEIQLASEHWLSIGRDGSQAIREALPTISGMTDHMTEQPGGSSYDIRDTVGRDTDGNLLGDPDEVGHRVERYREAGVDHLILRVIAKSIPAALESLRLFREAVPVQRLPQDSAQ